VAAILLCPSSGDTNNGGKDVGPTSVAGCFGPRTVSYAGLHYYSTVDEEGAAKQWIDCSMAVNPARWARRRDVVAVARTFRKLIRP
jgi:hypothetical protein